MTRNIQRILYWCILHDGERQDRLPSELMHSLRWPTQSSQDRSNFYITQFHQANIGAIYKLIFQWSRANYIFEQRVLFMPGDTRFVSWGSPGSEHRRTPPAFIGIAAAETTWHFPRAAVTPLELNWFAWMFLFWSSPSSRSPPPSGSHRFNSAAPAVFLSEIKLSRRAGVKRPGLLCGWV